MTKEIYNAMSGRLYMVPLGMSRRLGWKFYNFGLNDGLGPDDVEFIPSFIVDVNTRNCWNACQRAYSQIRAWFGESVDDRLLSYERRTNLK